MDLTEEHMFHVEEEEEVAPVVKISTFEERDEIDPNFEAYLQTDFQDAVVSEIFDQLKNFLVESAAPVCEFFEYEDIEDIINDIFSNH